MMLSKIEAICTARAIGNNLRAEGKSYQGVAAWSPCYAGYAECVETLGQSQTLSHMMDGFLDK